MKKLGIVAVILVLSGCGGQHDFAIVSTDISGVGTDSKYTPPKCLTASNYVSNNWGSYHIKNGPFLYCLTTTTTTSTTSTTIKQ